MNLRNYAYIGDAVWELKIRSITITQTNNSKKLHLLTTQKVNATYQADCLHKIDSILTDEELDIARRGRNLPIPIGRRQIQAEYRQATAFETLIGWWYLNNPDRIEDIYKFLGI